MDEKSRKNELIEFFFKLAGVTSDMVMDSDILHQFEFELNGWEGLIVYSPNGMFCQMNYKRPDIWSIIVFPYDIYGKKTYNKEKEKWEDKG